MKNKKLTKIIAIALIITTLAISLSGCLFMGNGDINEYADELFGSLFTNDALSANFFLENPDTYNISTTASLYEPSTKQEFETGHNAMRQQAIMMAAMFKYDKMNATDKELFDFIQSFLVQKSEFAPYYYFQNDYIGRYMGTQPNLPIYLTEYKFRTKKDVLDYLTLCNQTETVFPKYIAYEQERIDNGYGRAEFVIEGALAQCESFSGVDIASVDVANIDKNIIPTDENFVLTNFKQKVNACEFLTAEEKTNYINQATISINTKLIPSYIQLGIDLKNILTNTAPEKFNNEGLANFENGKEYYQVLFNDATGTTIGVNEAYLQINDAFAKSRNDLNVLASQIRATEGENYDIDAAIQTMFDNDNWETDALYNTITTLKNSLGDNFPAIPDSNGEIVLKQIDESLSDNYSPAAFFVSPLDNLNSNETIVINNADGNNPGYLSYDLLAHEGIPGHLYQYSYAKHSSLNNVVKVLSPTCYKEGWATYVQHYMANFYKTGTVENLLYQYYLLNTLSNGYMRCMVDIWVNYNGLSLTEVNAEIAGKLGLQPNEINAENLYNSCVEVPTNALTYYYSYYNMMDIKSKLTLKGYSDLEFHQAILDAPYSFDLIRAKYSL